MFQIRIVLVCFVLILTCGVAPAVTWTVEKDGSGQFTVIQDAVDAAASGDTIRIGPGRFEDFRHLEGLTGGYIARILVDDLAIIGSGPGQTILGSEEYSESNRLGIQGADTPATGRLVVADLTIESVETGINNTQECNSIVARNVEFVDARYGILAGSLEEVSDCRFVRTERGAVWVNFADSVRIQRCEFIDCYWGIRIYKSRFAVVDDCRFEGISPGEGIAITATPCTITGNIVDHIGGPSGGFYPEPYHAAIDLRSCADVTLLNNRFSTYDLCLQLYGGSITAEDNVFEIISGPGLMAYFLIWPGTVQTFRRNHFQRGEGLAVIVGDGGTEGLVDHHIDMRENWWGTVCADSIAAWIVDGNDPESPMPEVFVDFEPFLDGPVPAEKTSLGGLKTLFR